MAFTRQLGENNHSEYAWAEDIREKLSQFFFQLVRTSDNNEITKIKKVYKTLLEECFFKQNINNDITNEYKYVLLTIPLHTRDIIDGKGEYQLFYILIGVLCKTIDEYSCKSEYKLVADKLMSIIKIMIRKTLSSENKMHQYGSWKDAKYLLNHLKDEYGNEDNIINHKIFDYIIELLCKQLKEDTKISESHNISLLAKWLPREKSKKFGWQARHIANDLFLKNNKDDMSYNQYKLAEKKSLTYYRKLIASLNNILKTPQINQCNNTWSSINFDKNVTSITLQKQKYAFQNINKITNELRSSDIVDRMKCRSNYLEYLERCKNKSTTIKSARVEIVDMVREALRLTHTTSQPDKHIIEVLNMQWEESGKLLEDYDMSNFVAMVDTSGSMTAENGNPLHSAIGLGLRIAENSKLGKHVMTFSKEPKWIELGEEKTLTEMARKVADDSSWQMNTNIEAALRLMLRSCIIKDLAPLEVKNMVLVIFSDMQIDEADNNVLSMNELIKQLFSEAGKYTSHKTPYEPCHILYWNLRSTTGFPCLSSEQNISMLSGYSPQLLKTFCKEGLEGLKKFTPWNCLLNQLQNERYIWVEEYIIVNK